MKITVQLKNWKTMNQRRDVKASSWFRLEHSLIDDPDFYDFTDGEFRAWIYIMSMASRKNSDTVTLNTVHADRAARILCETLQSAIKKLEEIGTLIVHVTDALRPRNENVTEPLLERNATDGRTDVTNETDGGGTNAHVTPAAQPRIAPSKAEIISIEKKREQLCASCAQSIWTALENFKHWQEREAMSTLGKVACWIVNANGGWKALAQRFQDMKPKQSQHLYQWRQLALTRSEMLTGEGA